MTLTELKYIISLAKERHFGRAADLSSVSQPTLSVAIKKLEQELGVDLFERSKNAVNVTPIGVEIVEKAQKVLDEVKSIESLALYGKDQLKSPLRLGTILTVGPYLLPHLITQLGKTTPDMPLFVEENYTAELRKQLREGELDAILVALPFTEPDVLTKPLYDEPFVVVMNSHHPLAQHSSLEPEQIMSEDVLLLGEGHCFRDQVLGICPNLATRSNSQLHAIARGSSLETLKHMVASGLGISVLPASATHVSQYPEGTLVTRPIKGEQAYRTIGVAWRASFTRPKVIDVLEQSCSMCRLF
jgi:LysR family hydrogen peroxide-inducible transcriptional activator